MSDPSRTAHIVAEMREASGIAQLALTAAADPEPVKNLEEAVQYMRRLNTAQAALTRCSGSVAALLDDLFGTLAQAVAEEHPGA
jgi:hypothetical protein